MIEASHSSVGRSVGDIIFLASILNPQNYLAKDQKVSSSSVTKKENGNC